MSGFFQDVLKGAAETFFGNPFLRDYTHASKTFRTNAYQNAPKFKYLFHVYFDITPAAAAPDSNYGLLVKTVKLPSFTFDAAHLNQYNRKRIVQTKIKYETVDITFHDDNGTASGSPLAGGSIRNLWKAYYNYYYADGNKPQVQFAGNRGAKPGTQVSGGGALTSATEETYYLRNQYKPSITGNDDWGYVGDTIDPSGAKIPFFKNITIFGFSQHNFVAYTLVNPIITRFSHDTYDYAQGAGTMEMQMGLDYETVVYNEGALSGKAPGDIVTGFGDPGTYDRTPSPIMRPGANQNILGQGGLVDGLAGTLNSFSNGNYLDALRTAGTTYNTFKNADLSKIAKAEITNAAVNYIEQTPNRNQLFSTPVAGGSGGSRFSALGSLVPSLGKPSPQQVGPNPYAGQQLPNGPTGPGGK